MMKRQLASTEVIREQASQERGLSDKIALKRLKKKHGQWMCHRIVLSIYCMYVDSG